MPLPHHQLVAWQRADDLFIHIHRVTKKYLPPDEKFELGAQLRRSAYSVPANIVEGNSRDSVRDTLRFFNIASASLSEAGYGLHAAHRLGYLSDSLHAALEDEIKATSAPLRGLIKNKRANLATKITVQTTLAILSVWQLANWLT
jgi:four helix bundle protein